VDCSRRSRGEGRSYALVGVLAVRPVLGDGGKARSRQGELTSIARHEYGEVLIVALGVGLDGALQKLAHHAMDRGFSASPPPGSSPTPSSAGSRLATDGSSRASQEATRRRA